MHASLLHFNSTGENDPNADSRNATEYASSPRPNPKRNDNGTRPIFFHDQCHWITPTPEGTGTSLSEPPTTIPSDEKPQPREDLAAVVSRLDTVRRSCYDNVNPISLLGTLVDSNDPAFKARMSGLHIDRPCETDSVCSNFWQVRARTQTLRLLHQRHLYFNHHISRVQPPTKTLGQYNFRSVSPCENN